jgi:hypothetical protein
LPTFRRWLPNQDSRLMDNRILPSSSATATIHFTLYEPRQMLDENKAYFKKILNDFLNRYPFNPDLFPQTVEAATAGTP